MPDAWVGQSVPQVGQQIAAQGQHCAQHQVAHNQRVVAGHDRCVKKLAQSGQGEDGFNDHAAADKAGNGQSQNGDQR